MMRNFATVEWQCDIEPEEWEQHVTSFNESGRADGLSVGWTMNAKRYQILGLLLILFAGGFHILTQTVYSRTLDTTEPPIHPVEHEDVLETKTSVTALETIAAQRQSEVKLAGSPRDRNEFRVSSSTALRQIALHDDLAFVEVSGSEPSPLGREIRFQQTIIYRQHVDGWISISPEQVNWGPHQELATHYFRVRYRQVDADTIARIAPLLDEMYETLLTDYGLPSYTAPITVQVDERGQLYQDHRGWNVQERIHILSPALRKLPAQDSHADILATQIAGMMATRFLGKAQGQLPPDKTWRLWIDTLYEWQVEQYSPTFINWRHEVTRWLLTAFPNQLTLRADSKTLEALQADIMRLCATYREQVHISSLHALDWRSACHTDARSALQFNSLYLPVTLEQAGTPYLSLEYPPGTEIAANVMRTSLLNFVVAEYGREAIGALFAGFGEHERWETLTPVVFDLPAEEFEAKWQQFLLDGGCREASSHDDCQPLEVAIQ